MSRFERKIFLAIGLTLVLALGGTLFFGRRALREAYEIGVNRHFGAQLEEGVAARRAQLMALRSDSEHVADAIRWAVAAELRSRPDPSRLEPFLKQRLADYESVQRISVLDADGTELAAVLRAEAAEEPLRLTVRTRQLQLGGRSLSVEVEVAAPEIYFERLQQAGEAAEVYSRLQRESASVSDVHVWAFGLLVFFVVVIAYAVGAVLSRRVAHRVTVLAEATRRVAAGDFTVTLPTGSTDEVSELTLAFNDMVRDLRESRARIEYLQRIGAWQEFARRLAHEIKNPLTPIQLAAQEMERTYDGEDEAYREKLVHACAIIEEEVATLRRLVGEFSAFARLPQADLVEADVAELVASIEDSVPAMLGDLGVEDPEEVDVQIHCAREAMPVRMDLMMLKRGIDNLLRNAIQAVHEARPEGGGRVRLDVRPQGRKVWIEVRDNGAGIPPEDWERVFDPYYTTKAEGTGLGLPIVKKVVLEHGGEVTLDRAPEGGAWFRIEIPLEDGT
jgi:two-component system nitrogen regulation sensor histidine kinase NtrY